MEKIKSDRTIDYSNTDVDINYIEDTVDKNEYEDTVEFTEEFLNENIIQTRLNE